MRWVNGPGFDFCIDDRTMGLRATRDRRARRSGGELPGHEDRAADGRALPGSDAPPANAARPARAADAGIHRHDRAVDQRRRTAELNPPTASYHRQVMSPDEPAEFTTRFRLTRADARAALWFAAREWMGWLVGAALLTLVCAIWPALGNAGRVAAVVVPAATVLKMLSLLHQSTKVADRYRDRDLVLTLGREGVGFDSGLTQTPDPVGGHPADHARPRRLAVRHAQRPTVLRAHRRDSGRGARAGRTVGRRGRRPADLSAARHAGRPSVQQSISGTAVRHASMSAHAMPMQASNMCSHSLRRSGIPTTAQKSPKSPLHSVFLAVQRATNWVCSASGVPADAAQSSSLKNAEHCFAIWQSKYSRSGPSTASLARHMLVGHVMSVRFWSTAQDWRFVQ